MAEPTPENENHTPAPESKSEGIGFLGCLGVIGIGVGIYILFVIVELFEAF